jgi:hypothetical protein
VCVDAKKMTRTHHTCETTKALVAFFLAPRYLSAHPVAMLTTTIGEIKVDWMNHVRLPVPVTQQAIEILVPYNVESAGHTTEGGHARRTFVKRAMMCAAGDSPQGRKSDAVTHWQHYRTEARINAPFLHVRTQRLLGDASDLCRQPSRTRRNIFNMMPVLVHTSWIGVIARTFK